MSSSQLTFICFRGVGIQPSRSWWVVVTNGEYKWFSWWIIWVNHNVIHGKLPSATQTWLAGTWTIEIGDFPRSKPPFIGDFASPCLIIRGYNISLIHYISNHSPNNFKQIIIAQRWLQFTSQCGIGPFENPAEWWIVEMLRTPTFSKAWVDG